MIWGTPNLQMWRLSGTVRSYRSNQPHISRSLSHSSSERWHGSRVSTVSLESKHSMTGRHRSVVMSWKLSMWPLNTVDYSFELPNSVMVKRICAACEGSCCNWTRELRWIPHKLLFMPPERSFRLPEPPDPSRPSVISVGVGYLVGQWTPNAVCRSWTLVSNCTSHHFTEPGAGFLFPLTSIIQSAVGSMEQWHRYVCQGPWKIGMAKGCGTAARRITSKRALLYWPKNSHGGLY